MYIDAPRKNQVKSLCRLWQEAFADPEESLRSFVLDAIRTDRCRCVTVDGTVAAALYWFPCRCRGRKIAYLYAVATDKRFRGRGICHALMEDTHRYLAGQGYEGAVLVPGEVSLFRFYETMGYRVCSQVREFSCVAGEEPVPLFRVSGAEYAVRRRQFLPEGSVIQEEENIDYLEKQADLYAGPGLLLAAKAQGGVLRTQELLGDASAAPAILKTLKCASGSFRTPGAGRDFAMYRSLENYPDLPPRYFGLAFD